MGRVNVGHSSGGGGGIVNVANGRQCSTPSTIITTRTFPRLRGAKTNAVEDVAMVVVLYIRFPYKPVFARPTRERRSILPSTREITSRNYQLRQYLKNKTTGL